MILAGWKTLGTQSNTLPIDISTCRKKKPGRPLKNRLLYGYSRKTETSHLLA